MSRKPSHNPNEIPILPEGVDRWPEPEQEQSTPVLPTAKVPSTRQTLSYLRSLFEAHGLDPKSKLGQNYLIDLNLIDLIVRSAEVGPDDCVLEVGTGTGSLTGKLADVAGHVVSIEIDKTFQPLAQQIVGPRENVTFMQGDCLAKKSELNPDMIAAWQKAAEGIKSSQLKLVANLPYVIATPLISNLLVTELPIKCLCVMVQWEIAERLRAMPQTKDYNALSVLTQSLADVELVRKVLPSNFYPRPKVDSAIVKIEPVPEKRAKIGNVLAYRAFLRNLYIHRRKNLRQALSGWATGRRDKADIDRRLKEIDIDGSIRAETLNLEDHHRLFQEFQD